MDIQKIPAGKLNPAAYNPRKDLKPGDKEYEKLKRSIEEYGCVELVVWNKRTGNVVSGHQRLKVLLGLGYTDIDCIVIDLDEQSEKALNLAMNKIGGSWDEDKLSSLIADLDAGAFDISLTGFDAAEIDELMNRWYSKEAVQDKFDVDKEKDIIEKDGAITQRGDIWLLGSHRLMCGDSTSAEDFEKLMDGRRAQVCVTSPPYDVGKDYEQKGIEPWLATMKPVIKNICKNAGIVCWNLGDLYSTGGQFIEPNSVY
ncbi:MAG: ParB N-terminal domain-containing protein, partial [Spirochaetota bacterium]